MFDWHWLIVIFLFAVFISPVVYCYYLQFNLHPEKISQGIKGVNGVKYILWSHSFDRIKGHERFGAVGKEDHFFFLHTFLWTFAPWCFVALIGLVIRVKNFFRRKEEWLSTAVFVMLAALINFSNFKLPHYLPILAPATALIVAYLFVSKWNDERWKNPFYFIQLFASVLLLATAALINVWAFPVKNSICTCRRYPVACNCILFFIERLVLKDPKINYCFRCCDCIVFLFAKHQFLSAVTYLPGRKTLGGYDKRYCRPKRCLFLEKYF